MIQECADDIDSQMEQFTQDGYAVIPDALSSTELESLRAAYDDVIAREKDVGTRRGWHNSSYIATYNLAQKDRRFWPLLEHPVFSAWMTRYLGPNFFVSHFNAHGMKPGGEEQDLHIDQEESTPGLTVMAQGLFALDDFTIENGCTRVIPRSHRGGWSYSDYRNRRAEFEARTVRIEASAGSLVTWHAGLAHGGSANRTNKDRRCITLFSCRAWVRAHCDYTRSLSPDVIGALNETQKRRLGFFAAPGWYNYANDERFSPKS